MRVLLALLFVSTSVLPAGAQPFSNADRSRAKYTVADATPSKACSDLSAFAGDGIVSIAARVVAATADTPQHCRVTGVITPEVAFEINTTGSVESPVLHDGQRRPRRRSARHADQRRPRGRADQGLRHGAHQHRPRLEQGAERIVHPQQSTEGDRLRISRRARRGRRGKEDRRRLLREADHVLVLELLLERRPPGVARSAALSDDFNGIVANAPSVG